MAEDGTKEAFNAKAFEELQELAKLIRDHAPEDLEKLGGFLAGTTFVKVKIWIEWLKKQKLEAEEWLEEKQKKIDGLRQKLEELEIYYIKRLDAANKERLAFHAMLVECLPELPVELHERARIVLGLSNQDAPKPVGANEAFRDAFVNARDHLAAEGDRLEKAKVYAAMMTAIAQKQLAEGLEQYFQKAGTVAELAGDQLRTVISDLKEDR